jgi:hypothetical protein
MGISDPERWSCLNIMIMIQMMIQSIMKIRYRLVLETTSLINAMINMKGQDSQYHQLEHIQQGYVRINRIS